MDWVVGLGLLLLLVVSAVGVSWTRGDGQAEDEAWLPGELRDATLAYAERTFRSTVHGLVARLDRAYRLDGELTLVELKSRSHIAAYPSDIIELSVQRVALRDETGEAVSKVAYVAIQPTEGGAKHPLKVKLLSTRQIVALKARHEQLRHSLVEQPKPARAVAMCSSCGHRTRCRATYGDR